MSGSYPYLAAIEAFEQRDRENPPPKGAVLFIGSSTFTVWRTMEQDFAPIPVINRGFGGSEVTDVIRYAKRIVIPYEPRLIVFYSGDNDLYRGKTPESVFEDYKQAVSIIHQDLPKTSIALVSTKPSPARQHLLSNIQKLNMLLREYAMQDARLTYIDMFSHMVDAAGSPRADLYGPDGLHLNESGYQLWKKVILPFVSM